ncbi:MAG: TetR/AcrR family transcriptional regulator [Armatimonadota bacterium]
MINGVVEDMESPESAETVTPGAIRDSVTAAGQRREQTRRAILEAAWRALVRDGYEKITTRGIAKLAAVNVATLHYYFGSKELLLTEATRFATKGTESRMRDAINQAQTATAGLENLFTAIWDMVEDQPGALRYDLVVRGFRDEKARQDVLAIYAVYQNLTEELIERHLHEGGTLAAGMTASGIAHYILSATDGILLQHVLTGDAVAAQNALAMVKNHALFLLNAELK